MSAEMQSGHEQAAPNMLKDLFDALSLRLANEPLVNGAFSVPFNHDEIIAIRATQDPDLYPQSGYITLTPGYKEDDVLLPTMIKLVVEGVFVGDVGGITVHVGVRESFTLVDGEVNEQLPTCAADCSGDYQLTLKDPKTGETLSPLELDDFENYKDYLRALVRRGIRLRDLSPSDTQVLARALEHLRLVVV